MDFNSIQHAIEMMVPIAGTINSHRRKSDGGGMKPVTQILISIITAIIIGLSSGWVSAQVALAVQAEQVKQLKEANQQNAADIRDLRSMYFSWLRSK